MTKRTRPLLWHSILPYPFFVSRRFTARLWPIACLFGLLYGSPTSLAQTPIKVTVATAEEREQVQEVPLSGSVSSPQIALISTQVAGLVKTLQVDAGDSINQGDLLLELDRELSEIALDSAEAAAAQAREATTDSERRLAEARSLAKQNNIAASDVRALEAQVRIDEARLRETEAQVRQRQAELNRHRITAPFTGTISRKLTEVGEWVAPGTQVLELVATKKLRIDFQAPQSFYPQVGQDTEFSLRFSAYPDRQFSGRLQRKVPLADNNARTFLLRVSLAEEIQPAENPSNPDLIPGMSVDGTMKLMADKRALSVPRDALLRYPDGRISVWVIDQITDDDEATVKEQFVSTGLEFDNWVAIHSGLTEATTVVVEGNETLNDGQTVQVISARDETDSE